MKLFLKEEEKRNIVGKKFCFDISIVLFIEFQQRNSLFLRTKFVVQFEFSNKKQQNYFSALAETFQEKKVLKGAKFMFETHVEENKKNITSK